MQEWIEESVDCHVKRTPSLTLRIERAFGTWKLTCIQLAITGKRLIALTPESARNEAQDLVKRKLEGMLRDLTGSSGYRSPSGFMKSVR